MNEELLNKDIAKEVLTIILYSDNYIQNRIPEDIIKKLTNLSADSELDIHLDKNKKLQEQNISSDALDMFALLYYSYVADENEQDEILSSWYMNDKNTVDN